VKQSRLWFDVWDEVEVQPVVVSAEEGKLPDVTFEPVWDDPASRPGAADSNREALRATGDAYTGRKVRGVCCVCVRVCVFWRKELALCVTFDNWGDKTFHKTELQLHLMHHSIGYNAHNA
jgi:hypothetical protein